MPKTITEKILTIPQANFRAIAQDLSEQIVTIETTPIHHSDRYPLPAALPQELRDALQQTGITSFYHHQIEALECLRSGKDLCLATPTASGKTLCYNPSIFEYALTHPQATALYIFPLKALALDQLGKLQAITNALPSARRIKVGMITGDISFADRKQLFIPHPPQILVVSPDLLHYQLYKIQQGKEGENWREFLRNLKWIVLDEAHTYFGAFGAHIANLLRRVRVAVDTVGGDSNLIQFIFASATIGNPHQIALRFSGRENTPNRLHLISGGGISQGRSLVCLQPSNAANFDASKIVISWLHNNVTGIVFCNSRSAVKSLLGVIQTTLYRENEGYLASQIRMFYGSLKNEQRQDIIQQISRGKIKIILSTSALEAGIDLPELDCCLIRGYPGSIMSFWQRVGRVGRQNPGLAIFLPVAQNPLDYYFGNYPQQLLNGEVESAFFNPDYPLILSKHLHCSCFESKIPIKQINQRFGSKAEAIAKDLLNQNKIFLNNAGYLWGNGYPHKEVNLRGTSQDSIELIDQQSKEEFEVMSRAIAVREVFPGAIYTAQDSQGNIVKYRSQTLELEQGKANLVRYEQDPGLFTEAIEDIDITLLQKLAAPQVINTTINKGAIALNLAWGKITSLVTGYKLYQKKSEPTCTNSTCRMYRQSIQAKSCPICHSLTRIADIKKLKNIITFEHPYQTTYEAPIVSVQINPEISKTLKLEVNQLKQSIQKTYKDNIPYELETLWLSSAEFIALHSIEHQITFALPLLVLSSSQDLSGAVFSKAEGENFSVEGYFFDNCHGGNGAAEAVFNQFSKLAAKAKSLAENCQCEIGCPRCLFQPGCPHQNQGLHKGVGLFMLDAITEN